MKKTSLKSCAVINDLSGFGRCALTVSLPVLSALGVRACPVPTAILSNHTGFEDFSFSDFTDSMEPYFEKWESLGLSFDGIYTGFLGSERQVDIISGFIDKFKKPETLLFVDPVMGDGGKLYSTYTDELVAKMRSLSERADVITPNLTEAAFLLDIPYSDICASSEDELFTLCEKLCQKGAGAAVITGIRKEGKVLNFAYDKKEGRRFVSSSSFVGGEYCGTGDLFASILCGTLIQGAPMKKALRKATEFSKKAVKYSFDNNISPIDGIAFEPILGKLL